MISHISVCICTFRRNVLLNRLLCRLEAQRTHGLFTYDVVVADNDAERSGEAIVRAFASKSHLRVTYCVEPEVNIARARNRALAHAQGEFVALIDDDEFPESDWLHALFQARARFGSDGVLGPVIPQFQREPPQWLQKGRFFDRRTYDTGQKVPWNDSRTGNVLFDRGLLDLIDPPFRTEFAAAGEDVDFFRRLDEAGCTFVWCNEAAVFESVPPSRCTRRYLLRRAALRGSTFPKYRSNRLLSAAKSLVALPCYTMALPVLAILGQHLFLAYLIRIVDHATRLMALAGFPLINDRETPQLIGPMRNA